jgi:two-component system, OmpR family, sensor histidine kinase KdpD
VQGQRLDRTELALGLLVGAGAVTLVSLAIGALRPHMPVISLGVLYVFAVLAVAVRWGIVLAAVASVASMLAFNWFFLPPTHTFQMRDGTNWAVLAVYLVTAVVVSGLAARARRRQSDAEQRRRESDVLAELAADLLRGADLVAELDKLADMTARVLRLPAARIELGEVAPAEGERALPIEVDLRLVATLLVGERDAPDRAVAGRFLPALAALLAVAVGRAELEAEALEAEALRRSDVVKTALLRAVSHDLRSPLTAIVAGADALASDEIHLDEADQAALVAAIREEAQRLDRVVANLLDVSRLEAGALDTHRELWAVDELVGRALDSIRLGGDRIVVELDPDAPPVRVDAAQIERVIANLIENALRFSPSGTPVVVRAEHGATELRIHVVDRGPGVAASNRDTIFQPFRSDGSGGSGLGLAIARGFAEANGGRVWTQEDPAGGHFVLALATAPRPAVRA